MLVEKLWAVVPGSGWPGLLAAAFAGASLAAAFFAGASSEPLAAAFAGVFLAAAFWPGPRRQWMP